MNKNHIILNLWFLYLQKIFKILISFEPIEYDIHKVRVGFKIYANDAWYHILQIKKRIDISEFAYEFTCEAKFKGRITFCINRPTVWVKKYNCF